MITRIILTCALFINFILFSPNIFSMATPEVSKHELTNILYSAIVHYSARSEAKVMAYLSSLPPTATIEDINPTLINLFPALHFAASKGQTKLVRLFATRLALQGLNPNPPDNNDNTPLHFAAANGHISTVVCLVEEFGANVFSLNSKGQTPITMATGHLVLGYFTPEYLKMPGE